MRKMICNKNSMFIRRAILKHQFTNLKIIGSTHMCARTGSASSHRAVQRNNIDFFACKIIQISLCQSARIMCI